MKKSLLSFTDFGNADRFVRDHSKDVRYCPALKIWLVWNGSRWAEDHSLALVHTKAKQTILNIPKEVDQSRQDEILKHAKKSQTPGKVNAMLKLAQSVPTLQVTIDQLDANPWLLNCANYTIDLKTGKSRPHAPADYLTLTTDIAFKPNAKCPHWMKVVDEITAGNQGLVLFLQQLAGYSLTGSTREQSLYFLIGRGSNGKTTLVETLRKVLGQYARHTPTSTLLKNNQPIRNDLARLKKARLVTASEITTGRQLDEATAKQLTGEDPVTSRYLRAEYFEYHPSYKLLVLANTEPEIKGTDWGIWRRIVIIPFPVTFSGNQIDKTLSSKLEAELPGILNWAIKGCLDWQARGLVIPKEVTAATENYRRETDILDQFLEDCCVRDNGSKTSSRDLYEVYKAWANENCDEILKPKSFGLLLRIADFKPSRDSKIRYWKGLTLKAEQVAGVETSVESEPAAAPVATVLQ